MNGSFFWIQQAASHQLIVFSSPAQYSRTTQGMNREQLHPSKLAAYRTTPLRAMEIRTFFFGVLGSPPWRNLMARRFFENKDYWKSNDIYHAHMDLEWFGYDTSIERWWLICSGSVELLIFRWFGYDMFGRFAREKPDRVKKGYTVIPGGHESSRLSGTLVEQFLVWKPWRGWVTNDTTRRRWTQWTSHGSILPYCSHLIVPKMFNNSPIIFSH